MSGIILKRNFTEGGDVKAGESLYQIDPATYQASYESAKGDGKSASRRQNRPADAEPLSKLLGTKYISQQDYDTALADAQQANAAVVAAKAAVETARINLAYTKVTSLSAVVLVNLPSRKGRWYRTDKPLRWLPCSSLIRSTLT